MKLINLLKNIFEGQVKKEQLIQIIEQIEKNDLLTLMHTFGGAVGRGKASTFNNFNLIKNLSDNIKFKTPKKLYRGIALPEDYNYFDWENAKNYVRKDVLSDNNKLLSYASGLRSWSKNISFAKFYTWNHLTKPIRFLFIWENPKAILSGDVLNRKANELKVPEPLDDAEFICNLKPSENTIIKKEIDERKSTPLYIITIRGN